MAGETRNEATAMPDQLITENTQNTDKLIFSYTLSNVVKAS